MRNEDLVTRPVLVLRTNEPRQQVRIDGKLYSLRRENEFSIPAYRRAWAHFGRLAALMNADDGTAEDDAEVCRRLREMCELILDAPPGVQASLNDAQRLQIIGLFSQRLTGDVAAVTPAKPRKAGARRRISPR